MSRQIKAEFHQLVQLVFNLSQSTSHEITVPDFIHHAVDHVRQYPGAPRDGPLPPPPPPSPSIPAAFCT